MNAIEIICTVIGAIATILAGMYFIINKAVNSGVKEHRLTKVEGHLEGLPCDRNGSNLRDMIGEVEKLGEKINKLPCDKHHEDISKSNANFDNMNQIVLSTNEMVSEISKWVMKMDNGMIDTLAKKASPLKMTPIGEVLFEKSLSKKAIDENIDFLIKELEGIAPKTAFDVEDQAYSVLFKNIGHDLFNEVKNFIYYSPETIELIDPSDGEKEQIKISLQTLIRLMGIYLRDKYLERHTEIENNK